MWQTWDAAVLLAGMCACSFPPWDGYFNIKRRTFPWWPGLQTQQSLHTSELCPPSGSCEQSESLWVCWREVNYGLGLFLLERQVGATLHPDGTRGFQPQECSRSWPQHKAAAAPGRAVVPKHSFPARLLPSAGSAAGVFLGGESTGEM